jgi:hypothetical protein
MGLFNFFKKPPVQLPDAEGPYADSSTNFIYNLLFCDNIDLYKDNTSQPYLYPFDILFSQKSTDSDLQKIIDDSSTETRVKILSYNGQLANGHKPNEKELLAVIDQDYDCQIRTRLTNLIIKENLWWSISDDGQRIANEVIEGLNSHGIPWLNLFESRAEICNNWGIVEGSSRRAKLDVALVVLNENKEKGSKLIQDYYNSIETHKGHKEYVEKLADQLGVKINA